MAVKKFVGLTALHENWEHVIVTAHRGASGCFPENTLLAFHKAVMQGADMLEFDLRVSKDGIPVVLHDKTLNRTSDLDGKPEDFTLEQLRCGNFSYYSFGADAQSGRRQNTPSYANMPIPTFEDVLKEFHGQVGMNIQVYAAPEALREICRLYKLFNMYDQGYLTLASLADVEFVRKLDAKVEICFTPPWTQRGSEESLHQCKKLGCRFVQPVVEHSGPECYRLCRELKLRTNAFYSDTDTCNRIILSQGATGIISNRPDVVLDTLRDLGRR